MMSPFVQDGDILDHKYRVERILGCGGMGIVVAARHLQLDELVAIKFIRHEEDQQHHDVISRFLREARAAVRLKGEHVARVMDVGTLETGSPYIVMEYLEGRDMADLLCTKVRIPTEECIEYVLQAAEALAEAHAHGIVHRDVKPSNLFVTRRPNGSTCIKVLDFGVSKMTAIGHVATTSTNAVMGTPLYMAPEHMRSSRDVDARSDIWALGVVLYELVTGEPPFVAETLTEICYLVHEKIPRSLQSFHSDVPEALEAIVLRALQKDPAKRYQTVIEFATDLAALLPPRSRSPIEWFRPSADALAPTQSANKKNIETESAWSTAKPKHEGRSFRFLLLGSIGLVLFFATRSHSSIRAAHLPSFESVLRAPSPASTVTSEPFVPEEKPVVDMPKRPHAAARTPARSSQNPIPKATATNTAAPIAPSIDPTAHAPIHRDFGERK